MTIWVRYGQIIRQKVGEVIEALMLAFEKSPSLNEVKIYFITLMIRQLSYKHIDRILTILEDRFSEIAEDGSNQYLLCNLNPILTSVHLLNLLSLIEERYSVTSLRTQNLQDTINSQARSVLEKLFFPE